MSLAKYYSTNYSKCNLSYSFLASWQGLAYPSHIIQVFALPIQILTFYIIWKKTPINMKMMKWPLLINHACCCWFDFVICTLSTPYVFFLNIAILGVGLLSWIGVPNTLQLVIGIESGFIMAASYIYLFETRSSSLQMNKFKIQKTWARFLYHVLIHSLNCIFLLLLWFIPENQEAAKLESLKNHPCPTPEFFENNILIIVADSKHIFYVKWVIGPIVLFNITLNALFHVICTVYHLYFTSGKSISMETRKNQQKFFVGIVFQTVIPLFLLLSLAVSAVFEEFTASSSQAITNFNGILFALHGIVESLAVLLVHRSYRRAVWKMLPERKARAVNDVHVQRKA